jgi:hypothetical protein
MFLDSIVLWVIGLIIVIPLSLYVYYKNKPHWTGNLESDMNFMFIDLKEKFFHILNYKHQIFIVIFLIIWFCLFFYN